MKKIISILLAATLAVTALAGCSKQEAPKADMLLKYTVDSHYDIADTSVRSFYEKLCEAVINGDEELKINTMLLDDVNRLYYTSFPLYVLVDGIDLLPDNTGFSIKYKNSPDEHKKCVQDFQDRINAIMQECGYGKTSIDNYIFNVYTYITANFKTDNNHLNVYDTLLNSCGYNASVNSLFEYLVLQGGGSACHVVALKGTSMISLVKFKNMWYYFDPASEINDSGGKALKYFAFSTNVAYAYTNADKVEEKGDNAFAALKDSQSFTVDGGTINVELKGGSAFELKIN